MTRRLVLVVAALALVLAACGGGVEENAGVVDVTVDTKPDTTGTTDDTAASATTAPDGGDADIPPGQDPRNILGGEGQEEDDAAVACFEGDMDACDELFSITEVDSDLEAYSQTCGGRIDEQDGAPNCADRFGGGAAQDAGEAQAPGDLTDDPELDASSPEGIANFGELADQCFEGDLGACDELFFQTPIGSDFEAYGTTCGGRLEEGVSGSCESQLGSGGSTDTTTSSN